jgi:hypothetical protein
LQCIYFHSDWWHGGRDDVVEGVWEWSSTGKPFSVSDWNPGQPYNLYQDQDCLRIWKKKHDYHWDDGGCAGHYKYICEARYGGVMHD